MMPLTFARAGEQNLIKKIGGNNETRRHLNNLGFVDGGTVEIISDTGGNLIVNVKESRIAISKEMANRIVVKNICYRNHCCQEHKINAQHRNCKRRKCKKAVGDNTII